MNKTFFDENMMFSYHFDYPEQQGKQKKKLKNTGPYVSYENLPDFIHMDDGSEVPNRKYFNTGWTLDETIRPTFKATINFGGKTIGGVETFEYEMKFNKECDKIVGGSVTSYLKKQHLSKPEVQCV